MRVTSVGGTSVADHGVTNDKQLAGLLGKASRPVQVGFDSARLKLSYFDARGRAELTRIIMAYGQIDYEDDRVKMADFKKIKESGALPFDQFPILWVNGRAYSQSYAVARYAAGLCGLLPSTQEGQLCSDMIMLTTEDVRSKFVPIRYSGVPDPERLEKYNNF